MGLDVEVGASLTIGDLNSALAEHRKKSGGLKFTIVRGSGSIIGTGVVAQFPIVCQGSTRGPNVGYVWELASVQTFSQDDHTIYNPTPGTSFVGAVYLGGAPGDVGLSQMVLPGLTFPNFVDFSDGVYVQPGESIVISTSASLGVGQQIGANIWARQYRIGDVTELSGR